MKKYPFITAKITSNLPIYMFYNTFGVQIINDYLKNKAKDKVKKIRIKIESSSEDILLNCIFMYIKS